MTNLSLTQSHLWKAQKRFPAPRILLEEKDFSDAVQKAQEVVELALKAMLRHAGIEPPKLHDVGPFLLQFRERFPNDLPSSPEELAAVSHRLRKEREFAFYGAEDFIPTEEYAAEEAERAVDGARRAVAAAEASIGLP